MHHKTLRILGSGCRTRWFCQRLVLSSLTSTVYLLFRAPCFHAAPTAPCPKNRSGPIKVIIYMYMSVCNTCSLLDSAKRELFRMAMSGMYTMMYRLFHNISRNWTLAIYVSTVGSNFFFSILADIQPWAVHCLWYTVYGTTLYIPAAADKHCRFIPPADLFLSPKRIKVKGSDQYKNKITDDSPHPFI